MKRIIEWFKRWFEADSLQLNWLAIRAPKTWMIVMIVPSVLGLAGMVTIVEKDLFPEALWSRLLAWIGWVLLLIGATKALFCVEGWLVGWFRFRRHSTSRRHNKHINLFML